MRALLLVLALAMAGGAIWLLFGQPDQPQGARLAAPGDEDLPAYLKLKRGTLTVRVRGPDGKPLPFAEVGYEAHPQPLLYGVRDDGTRTLSDVPLGEITVVVRAPGFKPERRRTRIEAGVTEEMAVVLSPVDEPKR